MYNEWSTIQLMLKLCNGDILRSECILKSSHLSHVMTIQVSKSNETNWAVQPQKMAGDILDT